MSLLTFPRRASGPERMDDPGCDTAQLMRTIRQFRWINLLFSGSRRLIRRQILSRMEANRNEPYTVLDLGAGGCDIPIWLARSCARRGITVKIYCLDQDPRILGYAHAVTAGTPEIEILEGSVFDHTSLPEVDFIFSNHFLHHFTDPEVVEIIDLAMKKSRRGLLMNDLRRSRLAWLGFQLFGLLFLHGSMSRYDGALSIRRGFTVEELRDLIKASESPSGLSIGRTFPSRVYLTGG